MTALPPIAEAEKLLPNNNPAVLGLYTSVLLPAEKAAGEGTDKSARFRVIFTRIVGYLLLYPPSDQARAALQAELEGCKDESKTDNDVNQHEAVYNLGKAYLMDFILPMYCPWEDMTPMPDLVEDDPVSFRPFQAKVLQSQPIRPRNLTEARGFVLIRDGFRCIVSRIADAFAVHHGLIPAEPQDSPWILTIGCHIFPEALGLEKVRAGGSGAVQMEHAPAFWGILGRFGYGRVEYELEGPKIHRLENLLTFAGGIAAYFRKQLLWFEPDPDCDGQPDCYRVCAPSPLFLEGNLERVRFVAKTAGNSANLPLPDPAYLRIHATCCRVTHLSGVWGHLPDIYYDGLEATMGGPDEDRWGFAGNEAT